MVLSYYETPSSIPLILDSVNFKIFPADKRKDLIPIYNFNGEALFGEGKNGHEVIPKNKIHKRWNMLVNDIKRNKL
jgi:hypothetical protein